MKKGGPYDIIVKLQAEKAENCCPQKRFLKKFALWLANSKKNRSENIYNMAEKSFIVLGGLSSSGPGAICHTYSSLGAPVYTINYKINSTLHENLICILIVHTHTSRS